MRKIIQKFSCHKYHMILPITPTPLFKSRFKRVFWTIFRATQFKILTFQKFWRLNQVRPSKAPAGLSRSLLPWSQVPNKVLPACPVFHSYSGKLDCISQVARTTCSYTLHYLGLDATKPVFGVSDQARLQPVFSAKETS